MRYVASGRDLLRDVKPASGREMVLVGNPDYDVNLPRLPVAATAQPNAQAPAPTPGAGARQGGAWEVFAAASLQGTYRSVTRRDLEHLKFGALPGTVVECKALQAAAAAAGWPVSLLEGGFATKAALYRVRSPRVLHLATHGFFLPEEAPSSSAAKVAGAPSVRGRLRNPMHRSGLALAGANRTLDAWRRGEVPPSAGDGILTAQEVGGLKLAGTWLVTLSACDTGSGEARSGEGVLGLRRGFVQAGAQHLMMTLWPVADRETAQFMQDFYAAARQDGNAPTALAEVQRAWLVRLRQTRGLQEAVRLSGPFIVSSQGRP